MSRWSATGSSARAGKRYKGQRDYYFSFGITTLLLYIVFYSYGCQNYVKHCKVTWWRPQPATPYNLEGIYRRFGGTSEQWFFPVCLEVPNFYQTCIELGII